MESKTNQKVLMQVSRRDTSVHAISLLTYISPANTYRDLVNTQEPWYGGVKANTILRTETGAFVKCVLQLCENCQVNCSLFVVMSPV